MTSMIAVYTTSTPLPRVKGPRRRRFTMGSMAVASRTAINSKNSTSWMRHSTYTPSVKPSTTRRTRATSPGRYLLMTVVVIGSYPVGPTDLSLAVRLYGGGGRPHG